MPQQVPLALAGNFGLQQEEALESVESEQQQGSQKSNNNDANIKPDQRQQALTNETGAIQQQVNGTSGALNGTNNIKKLNGLKNRIIQRPPPLILDKVSNFYDTANNDQTLVAPPDLNTQQANKRPQNQTNNSETSQQTNANHKFWASLNQNASRTRSGIISTVKNNNTIDFKQSSSIDSPGSLGADLIITHRNSETVQPNNRSTNSSLKQNSSKGQNKSNDFELNKELTLGSTLQQPVDDPNRALDLSNNSEPDDAGGGASDNGGGNLIGVDNQTPPASNPPSESNLQHNNEPPTSASSGRSRSNNPFLAMDDDELLATIEQQNNNFHKRPASFIAATDAASYVSRKQQQNSDHGSSNTDSRMVQDQFQNMHIGDQAKQLFHVQQANNQTYLDQQDAGVVIDKQGPNQHVDQWIGATSNMAPLYDKPPHVPVVSTHSQQQLGQPVYGVFGHNTNYTNLNSAINVDSESAVCKPPPSATMQLPVWTDAIYHLNNAILDTNSVAGGAENGQFIHIAESGDIILELNQIKVSGFTLAEFNELLESKSVHLLSAVQTKHSHGLSIDLKQFLSFSFPKNSMDKELQDLIRENIYRRTIPCTTRPPREGEVDKVDYHFLSKEQFVEMNNRGMLLECGMYGGYYYGTMRPLSDLNSLNIYGSLSRKEMSEEMRQPLNANHPALGLNPTRKEASIVPTTQPTPVEFPLYENHESLRMYRMQNELPVAPKPTLANLQNINNTPLNQRTLPQIENHMQPTTNIKSSSIVAVDSEALPHGWERVIDQTHGTYYIDHNTQRTQYEQPYEIELTKGAMGFGFTLVEAENGVLLVRSIIPGGPAHSNGMIRPGDILISAVGVSVAGLSHTDIARLFSTFAVGDRVRLTFARSTYVVDANMVPDEYLFSNGSNGDMAIAVNPDYFNQLNQSFISQSPHILVNQEYEFLTVTLKRGEQGFGFQISDSVAGQKVKKIQNNETCANLRQGDILINLNGQDITNLSHKEVVELLKSFSSGQDVNMTIKRKKRFRSKTPMAMHTESDDYHLDNAPLRNCKTPSLDGLMLKRSVLSHKQESNIWAPVPAISTQDLVAAPQINDRVSHNNEEFIRPTDNYSSLPVPGQLESHQIYGTNPNTNNELYYNQQSYIPSSSSQPFNSTNQSQHKLGFGPQSLSNLEGLGIDNLTNSVHPSETSLPPMKFANVNGLSQMNQYNNFMHNDKLVMMQMQQSRYQHVTQPRPIPIQDSSYNQAPLYSNSDIMSAENSQLPVDHYRPDASNYDLAYQNSYYANNEEIELQRVQYGAFPDHQTAFIHQQMQQQPQPIYGGQILGEDHDEYEYHQIDLDRGNTDSNWGIRLIGGSEVDRAISIGSIVFGGAASKNGSLKSGDEIISINGINVVGATHQHVVELISACSSRASLVIRRKKFAEACEVILTRNMDEGFGFVIISSGNCALIGRIIEGSPADRCQQLHVRDRIIAVNGRYITPKMQHPTIVNMIKECGSTLRLRIIPADCYTVELIKSAQNDNFGFSMRGGSEYDGTPLYILRVAPNGLARDLLNVGDQIIEINGIPTVGMTHQQAATIIKVSDPIVKLKLRRNYVTPPSLLVDSPRALQKFNQVTAEMKTVNQYPPGSYIYEGTTSSASGVPNQNNFPMMNINSNDHETNHQQTQETSVESNNMLFNQSLPLYAT